MVRAARKLNLSADSCRPGELRRNMVVNTARIKWLTVLPGKHDGELVVTD
jgi:hypothetical protein